MLPQQIDPELHVDGNLAAFRFFRACVKLNNPNMFTHFFKQEIFLPILNITAEESRRDTLLSASCQELFEYMRKVW